MKKTISIILGSLLTASIFSSVSLIHKNQEQAPIKVEASASSYWDSWTSSNSAALNAGGTTLVTALKSKITQVSDGSSNTISYNGLWDAYKTSDAVPGSNGNYIWDMYGGFQFSYQSGGKTYSKEGDCYNREHSVPKSWFSEHTPAYSDLVHLVPTDGKVNGMRSNYAFGEVASASYTYSFPARSYNSVQYQSAGTSKLGTPKSINGVSTTQSVVFEPDDQYKGDFARIYMYFAVRYGGGTCQATSGAGGAIFTSTFTNSNPYVTNYGLALLQKWHVQDPVSSKETNRNNAIESLQGNRNPFVDFPEWADKIFGTNYGGGGSSTSGSVTISQSNGSIAVGETLNLTATASDSSAITWSSSDEEVATVSNSGVVTGVAEGNATITASATIDSTLCTATCCVTVTSSGGSGGSQSEDDDYVMLTSIASIDESAQYVLGVDGTGFHYSGTSSWGLVALPSAQTPLCYTLTKGANNATFTAETTINSTTYYLTVPTSNTFTMGTSSTDIKLGTTTSDSNGQANYAVANTSTTTRHLRINGTSGIRSYAGTTGSMVYFYKVNSGSTPTPVEKTLSSISISGYKTTFAKDESFSFGGTVTAHYSDSSTADVTSSATFSGYNMSTTGQQTVTVSYSEDDIDVSTTYTIQVNTYRTVMEESHSVIGSVTYPNNTKTISVNTLSTSTDGYAAIESNAIRLGSGSQTGTVTVTSTTSNIRKVVVSAKSYGSDSSVNLSIDDSNNTITSSYAEYSKEYGTATNKVAIATTATGRRAYVQSITVYSMTSTDIGQSDDCLGLETFISNYMHMEYTSNLGYCKDSEHHYYSSAKTAFNALNTHQRTLFTTNTAYSSEWQRLSAWATYNGDTLNSSNVLAASRITNFVSNIVGNETASTVIILSLISVSVFGVYFFYLKHRKEQ